jgi:2-polyprenyl-3-methyl-5-hydroxy-6-metoxy-1,4-benzoquinol methylase
MLAACSRVVDHCPLCRNPHRTAAPFNRTIDCGIEWHYYICRRCSLVYQSPQMNEQESAAFYASDYWKLWGQTDTPDDEQTKLQQNRAAHLLDLRPKGHQVHRLLDIGCAAGFILREARSRHGATAVGIEPSESFHQFCREDGFTVHNSLDAAIAANEPAFDCVTMSHVLEHLSDPLATLRTIRERLLQATGVLLVEVPNLYAHRAFEAGHPICFTATTLRSTLAAAGFVTQELFVHNHPHHSIDRPLYLSAVAVPAAQARPAFQQPNVWLERVRRAYVAKRGAWIRRVWKGARIGLSSLFVRDLAY